MQIIKDKHIIADDWTFKVDDDNLDDGNVIISVSRLIQQITSLKNRNGLLGVRIEPSDSVEQIAPFLTELALIDLHFPELSDGRLFSHAWLLRSRYQFQGEIRATGHFLAEQVYYLSRVGVNAFQPEKYENLEAMLAGLKDFSVNYQPSVT
jgi:uncharacterized protein (DUF934 family)